ncbi:MAG: hypothetical protein Q9225_001594 [Loekoesia sp. 1 TL-2023]
MAAFKGATFEIISGGKTCPMYDDPDGNDAEDSFTQHKYIEAVTGAAFEVQTTLNADFDFATCDAVRLTVNLDAAVGQYLDIKRKDGLVEPGQKRSARLASIIRYSSKTGQWQKGALTFGKLEIKETSNSNPSPNDMKGLGQIQIRYQRVVFHGVRENQMMAYCIPDRVSEVSEKLLKGKSVENTIESASLP